MSYEDIFTAPYDREAWLKLLHDIFRDRASFWSVPKEVSVNERIAKHTYSLGEIALADREKIALYEVELTGAVNIERNRSGIRNLLVTEWRNLGYAGAFMFCYRKNEGILRFSYVSETWNFNQQGEFEKFSTDTKRYTYLLGEGRGCRTAVGQFQKLRDSKQTLSDITDAFSVEVLTKQFYKDLFVWYQWAISPDSGITFPNNTSIEGDDRDDIETKIIRMITRIMFVWFIKQKQLVPDKLFDAKFIGSILRNFDPQSPTDGNYYNAILQNLFFATLNREIMDEDGNGRTFATASNQRDVKNLYRYAEMFAISEQEVIDLFACVPFLNGGLFECLDKTKRLDGVEQPYNFDGFSRNDLRFADGRFKHRAVVPNILFFEKERGLISILSRYNFTIEENTPEEQQVALDPELLGKVFENLLAAYTPESPESVRKSTGSYYTPTEVVRYMVDESLIAYLGDTPLVRSLFRYDFTPDPAKSTEYQKITHKLKAIKVLDPACGSGAFPMGLLNRMVDVLERITPDKHVYDLKLEIIENCLYGCDIQSIAAQITKLRFFISLICDCEKDASKPNFGMPTLPNLETKFVAANSLIEMKRTKQRSLFENSEIETVKKELEKVRHKHFSAKSISAKYRLREKDREQREKLAQLLADENNFAPEDAHQMAAWNPYDQNAVSPFFDPEWMFGIVDGFDIVIGNPPYIQLQNNGGELAQLYEGCGYSTFARTGDIYCLFYERGWQLLKYNGHLCYITSNKWMRAGYGEKTRVFFANKTNPLLLIDFAGVRVFESATVDTNILLFCKAKNRGKTICAVTNKEQKNCLNNLSDFVQREQVTCRFDSADGWVVLTPIEQSIKRKIEAVGTPLKDWDINIYRGVLTGCNEAFIINTDKRNEILNNCQSEEERTRTEALIRPILRGRDIKRYGYVDNGLFLINTHNGIRGKFPRINIEDYPAVKAHLDQYWDKIYFRADQGDIPYNLRNCAYLEDFSKPKIIYPNMTKYMPFVFDNEMYLTNQKCFIITGKYVAYLTAFFNSSLFKYCFRDSFPELQGGTRELSKIFFDKIPVYEVSDAQNLQFQDAVEDIQKEYIKQKAQKIDSMLFDLYNLSSEEREAIGFVEIV